MGICYSIKAVHCQEQT